MALIRIALVPLNFSWSLAGSRLIFLGMSCFFDFLSIIQLISIFVFNPTGAVLLWFPMTGVALLSLCYMLFLLIMPNGHIVLIAFVIFISFDLTACLLMTCPLFRLFQKFLKIEEMKKNGVPPPEAEENEVLPQQHPVRTNFKQEEPQRLGENTTEKHPVEIDYKIEPEEEDLDIEGVAGNFRQRVVETKADSLCMVCFEKMREIVHIPCGHVATCSDCTEKMKTRNDRKCLICRQHVVSYNKFHLA